MIQRHDFPFAPPPPRLLQPLMLGLIALLAHALFIGAVLLWNVPPQRVLLEDAPLEAEAWWIEEDAPPQPSLPPVEPVASRPALPESEPEPELLPSEADIALQQQRAEEERQAEAQRIQALEAARLAALEAERQLQRLREERIAQVREQERIEQERQAREAEEAAAERERQRQARERHEREQREAAARKKAEQEAADRRRRQQAEEEKRHSEYMQRSLAMAAGAASVGGGRGSAGPTAGYAGIVNAWIRPHIVYSGSTEGNPRAEVRVRAAPDGTVLQVQIIRSSGTPAWDEAVVRALHKAQRLPRDANGAAPPPELLFVFRPLD